MGSTTATVVCAAVTVTGIFIWWYGRRGLRVLRRCGVHIVPGALPFLGHAFEFLKAEHFGAFDYDNIKKYGRVHGVVEMSMPAVVVAEPELLKEILLRKFNLFTDRRRLPLRGWMKLAMPDQRGREWKRIRSMLTPFFSVAKLKHSFALMHHPMKNFIQNLKRICEGDNVFEAHSVCGSLSLDVICATAFSLEIDSQNETDNRLLSTMRSLSNVSLASPFLFLTFVFPMLSPILEIFGISMFPPGYLAYFEKVAKEMIDERKNSNQIRPDFIQAMVKAHQEDLDYQTRPATCGEHHTAVGGDADKKKGLTDREIVAQVLTFFLGGYDTTARTLSFFMYNMALHQEIQEKLLNEIEQQLGDQVPNYENIQKLKYLDMCLTESLRLYPPLFRFDREASEDVTLGQRMTIPKGTLVVIPVWAIHHDPDLWPSPDEFRPERFADEGVAHDQVSYLAFGCGLRGCIGSRFAQLELKLAIVELLESFKVLINDRTQIPLQFENAFMLQPKHGIWLSLETRSTTFVTSPKNAEEKQ